MSMANSLHWKDRYGQEDLESVCCLACGCDEPIHITTEFMLNIVRCRRCGLIYVSSRPRDSEKNYWALTRAEMEKKYGAIFEERKPHDRDGLYRSHLETLARYRPSGRFLDIGTHCGFFLRHTKGRGREAEGVEPSPVSSELAREKFGLKVRTGSLASAAFPADTFDVITLLDVIEHLHDPRALLSEVHRIINRDGVFLIKTPNGTYNYFKHLVFHRLLQRADYDCFDAHEHVAAYTVPTLKRLLTETGWRVIAAMPSAPVQTYGSSAIKVWGRNVLYAVSRAWQAIADHPGTFATDVLVLAQKAN